MKKKFLLITIILLIIFLIYYVYINIFFNGLVDNTINYKDKINYSTNIVTSIKGINTSKIKYEVIKNSNKKKIILSNYINGKLENKIQKYIVDGKTYVYNDNKYEETKEKEKINVKYKYLKKSKIISLNNNKYKIKMKAYDAYNLIYTKDVMKKKDLDYYVIVNVEKDKKNNFIKEISYEINLNKENPLIYKVKIINSNINNHDTLKIPF